MLSKLITFIKNLHPIRNFARPINQPRTAPSSVSISYESLYKNEEQSDGVRLETIIPTFHEQESYEQTFLNTTTASYEDHEEQESSSVMVMPKIEVMQEVYQLPGRVVKLRVKEVPEIIPVEIITEEIISEVAPKAVRKKRAQPKEKAKKVVKPIKKTKKLAKTSPRKKKEVPPEARGFGF
jgi:hypothetical protein